MKQVKQLWERPLAQLGSFKMPNGKFITLVALVVAVFALVSALLSLGNSVRERQLLREQARTLPVLRRAAQRYLDEADARDAAEEPEELPF